MTMHRVRGKITWECDTCEDVCATETADFQEARAELRAEGWVSRKGDGDDWLHYCPVCPPAKQAAGGGGNFKRWMD